MKDNTPIFETENDFFEMVYPLKEKLLLTAKIKLRDFYEAEDAVSEAIMKACQKRNQLRNKEKLYSWLLRILINHCNDIFRIKRQQGYSIEDVEETPETRDSLDTPGYRYELEQEIERVLDIMLTLEPEEHREVVILYYYRKFSYEQIAETLEIPEGTVKSRMNRARSTLEKAFEKANIKKEDLEFVRDLAQWPGIRLYDNWE
ncbi:MAG: RNA polymerase sigma factor [bacterium]|nr:RNA polymerase sigma factor [bacterium]